MKNWAVITGAGTGIGAALAKELSRHDLHVLAIGRRLQLLQETQQFAPGNIHPLAVDIATADGQRKILDFIPESDAVKYLVQNAAVGVPSRLRDIQRDDFEHAFAVNVTAPLMLAKGFFPRLNSNRGRIIHLGTGVATKPQLGTITYGITKMAFQRLYEQLVVEFEESQVQIAEVLPGVVDTEGLWEHIKLANETSIASCLVLCRGAKGREDLECGTCSKRAEANLRGEKHKWNFDFENFQPLPGRFKWERVGKRLQTRKSPPTESCTTESAENVRRQMTADASHSTTRYNLRTRDKELENINVCDFQPIEPARKGLRELGATATPAQNRNTTAGHCEKQRNAKERKGKTAIDSSDQRRSKSRPLETKRARR
ncbi:hypothetical protein OS493_018282 [Desmophyllum pertusum]|uniref:Cyclin-dependent kinase inhibitor domain-containing protein n=1 Tax=Desmophyllum pertusum TaxID=174260 RepID=A0A9W9YDL8_9CNID|nr:hypothetical protein OS493_018282 [Desmophyllum pertusum]